MSTFTSPILLWSNVENFDETVRFYRDGFGFEIASVDPQSGTTTLKAGCQRLEVIPLEGRLVERKTGLSFHIHNVLSFVRHLADTALITREACQGYERLGVATLDVEDPAGNVVQLIEAGHS